MSRTHFSIQCRDCGSDGKQLWLTDSSGNGTYVNRQLVGNKNSVRLHDGDEIGFVINNGECELGYLITFM